MQDQAGWHKRSQGSAWLRPGASGRRRTEPDERLADVSGPSSLPDGQWVKGYRLTGQRRRDLRLSSSAYRRVVLPERSRAIPTSTGQPGSRLGVWWSHVHPQHIGPALPHQGGHGRGQPPVCRCSRSAVTWATSHVLNMLATVAVAPSSVIRGRATSTDLGISGGVCATKRLSTNTEALGPRSVQALQIP